MPNTKKSNLSLTFPPIPLKTGIYQAEWASYISVSKQLHSFKWSSKELLAKNDKFSSFSKMQKPFLLRDYFSERSQELRVSSQSKTCWTSQDYSTTQQSKKLLHLQVQSSGHSSLSILSSASRAHRYTERCQRNNSVPGTFQAWQCLILKLYIQWWKWPKGFFF